MISGDIELVRLFGLTRQAKHKETNWFKLTFLTRALPTGGCWFKRRGCKYIDVTTLVLQVVLAISIMLNNVPSLLIWNFK